jgi:hypothetical protein
MLIVKSLPSQGGSCSQKVQLKKESSHVPGGNPSPPSRPESSESCWYCIKICPQYNIQCVLRQVTFPVWTSVFQSVKWKKHSLPSRNIMVCTIMQWALTKTSISSFSPLQLLSFLTLFSPWVQGELEYYLRYFQCPFSLSLNPPSHCSYFSDNYLSVGAAWYLTSLVPSLPQLTYMASWELPYDQLHSNLVHR